MREVNLVFQGGGVKGVAFAGALEAIENSPSIKGTVAIRGVGGVSVGAITAALYAAGYSARELDGVLKSTPIKSLIPERRPLTPLGTAWRLWKRKGLYSTQKIYDWVKKLLEDKGVQTFADLKLPCRFLAANVTEGVYAVYSEQNPSEHVASAVVRSLSIPFFFQPYIDGQRLFVDGGLLSNYPLWLFHDSIWPTIGMKLLSRESGSGASPSSGFLQYSTSLVTTALGAHDKFGRGKPPNAFELPINAAFVDSTDFSIEDTKRDLLFSEGHKAASTFEWQAIPPPRNIVYQDPHAPEILEATANSIGKVFDLMKTLPKKRSYDYYHLSYSIEADGSGEEKKKFLIRNNGPEPVSMLRQSVNWDYEVDVSFKELAIEIASCTPSTCEVIVLPSKNTRITKEYVLMFVPPIASGDFREVEMRSRIPKAFLNLIGKKIDNFDLEIDHEDGVHAASLTLYLARTLGPLTILGEAGGTKKSSYVANQNAKIYTYDEYKWTFGPVTSSAFDFKVSARLH